MSRISARTSTEEPCVSCRHQWRAVFSCRLKKPIKWRASGWMSEGRMPLSHTSPTPPPPSAQLMMCCMHFCHRRASKCWTLTPCTSLMQSVTVRRLICTCGAKQTQSIVLLGQDPAETFLHTNLCFYIPFETTGSHVSSASTIHNRDHKTLNTEIPKCSFLKTTCDIKCLNN